MTLIFKSVDISGVTVNPIFCCVVNIAPHINPIGVGTSWSCPDNSKKVSFVGIWLVKAVL